MSLKVKLKQNIYWDFWKKKTKITISRNIKLDYKDYIITKINRWKNFILFSIAFNLLLINIYISKFYKIKAYLFAIFCIWFSNSSFF